MEAPSRGFSHPRSTNDDYEVTFVDDGSTDSSAKVLKNFRQTYGEDSIKCVSHPKNLGTGAALQAGFKTATCDLLITMDTDLTFSPSLIPILLKRLEQGMSMLSADR
ncbi:glycosyltransferase family 2 protein [Pajaroellobacter abortibovis]|nr:glycosyltransferase family 2 protein [Pajaroellobacter abortibovis]